MPETEAEPLRALDLERILGEQICASEILSEEALKRRVEDLLYVVDEMLQEAERRKDPHWWRYADLRDDLIDVLRAVKGERLSAERDKGGAPRPAMFCHERAPSIAPPDEVSSNVLPDAHAAFMVAVRGALLKGSEACN